MPIPNNNPFRDGIQDHVKLCELAVLFRQKDIRLALGFDRAQATIIPRE